MALKNPSLLLYGYLVDITNQFIDFQNVSAGPVLTATVPAGSYNLGDYASAIASALNAADAGNVYTVAVNRAIAGGTQNRITISTSGSFLSLLFVSGPNAASSIAPMAGFNATDYTGATAYTSSQSSGKAIIPVQLGYNFVSPNRLHKVFGSVNISATGLKEAIVYQIQKFTEVEFRYEPESIIDTVWQPFWDWAIQQQEFEFTPDITQPNTFYPVTVETTEEDGDGLGFRMSEMLPDYPGLYETGKIQMRVIIPVTEFIQGG